MADPLEFNNPFWDTPPEVGKRHTAFMSMPVSATTLNIAGQGTIATKSKATQTLKFSISTGDGYPKLVLDVTQTSCIFSKEEERNRCILDCEHVRPEADPCLPATMTTDGIIYWLSIDRSNWVLRYGKYYSSKALTILQVQLTAQTGAWLEKLTSVDVLDGVSPLRIVISRLPVTIDLPPLVVTSESVSLRELDLAKVTTWANLPKACQNLYHNIAGKGITLETTQFPHLAEAIHTSVTTPGYWGYNKLRSKCVDPDDPEEFKLKYLRVTIGSSKGNSPGIPYVMEVWPPGHKSVVHDHGDACAVIRVLSGTIQCTWYDSLESGKNPTRLGNPCLLEKDQITWLGENQYQVHSLKNIQDRTCVTLQCYEFGEENNVHDEKFWYVEENASKKKAFIPNSDSTFADFYNCMEWEWNNKNPLRTRLGLS